MALPPLECFHSVVYSTDKCQQSVREADGGEAPQIEILSPNKPTLKHE